MLIARASISLLLLVTALWPAAAQEVIKAPMPDWVVDRPIPEPRSERLKQVEDGLYYLLYDRQVRKTGPTTREAFRRIAYQVTERAGLEEGATVSWNFDPEHEVLSVHAIRLHRGDRVIDLTDAVEFITVRRETDLERGLLNGELTAHADLKDVRVGDIIETAVSFRSEDLIARGHLVAGFEPFYSVPLGHLHFRVIWPAGLPVTLRRSRIAIAAGADTEPTVAAAPDGSTVYTWSIEDREPTVGEAEVPSWHRQWGGVWMSSMQGWSEVVDDMLPYYRLDEAPLPPDFAAEVDRLAERSASDAERIARALRLVQDRVRYVGIEIGPGAFVPRKPATVLERGFGDCKDKSLLLTAALQRMGIDAAPALASLYTGWGLREVVPSPYAFDHMIVHVRHAGRDWWLDPTLTYQGGDGENVVMADYGNALPLRPGQSDLVAIADRPLEAPSLEVVEVFDFGGDGDAISLEVTSLRRDYSADSMRRQIAAEAESAIARSYLEFYEKSFPGIRQIAPLKVADDRDANRLTLTERYEIPKDALTDRTLISAFPMRGHTLVNVFKVPSTTGRRNPIFQSHPLHFSHEVVFRHPPVPLRPPESYQFDGQYFSVGTRSYASDEAMGVVWTLRSKTREVPPADAAEYVRDVNKYESSVDWVYDLSEFLDADGGDAAAEKESPLDWLMQRLKDLKAP